MESFPHVAIQDSRQICCLVSRLSTIASGIQVLEVILSLNMSEREPPWERGRGMSCVEVFYVVLGLT